MCDKLYEMRGLNRFIPRVPRNSRILMRQHFDGVTSVVILVNRGVVILTWFPGLCEIVLEALLPSAVLHFQSVVGCLPRGYNRSHQSFNDNDIVTVLSLQ